MDKTNKCTTCNEICTLCNANMCKDCMKNNNHIMCHTLCTECGNEITCNKNKLCKDCDRHPFDMDIDNNGKNMTLEDAFDSILTRNFEEYAKSEETKLPKIHNTLNKHKKNSIKK